MWKQTDFHQEFKEINKNILVLSLRNKICLCFQELNSISVYRLRKKCIASYLKLKKECSRNFVLKYLLAAWGYLSNILINETMPFLYITYDAVISCLPDRQLIVLRMFIIFAKLNPFTKNFLIQLFQIINTILTSMHLHKRECHAIW